MGFPPGVWTLRIFGQYLRPDGTPQRGYVTITPMPAAVGRTPDSTGRGMIVTQQAKVDIDRCGNVRTALLNPNDPNLSPGNITDGTEVKRWFYHVQETFFRGAVLGWVLEVPPDLGDRGELDLSKVPRLYEDVVRPADWFPGHFTNPLPRGIIPTPRGGGL